MGEGATFVASITCFYVETPSNLTTVIMDALNNEGGLTIEDIAKKVVSFGADGVNTFQGHKMEVTTQFREKWAPFSVGIHCISHRCNLAVETLSKFAMIARIESVPTKLHSYFYRSTSRHIEL